MPDDFIEQLQPGIETRIAIEMAKGKIPSLAVGVVRDQELVWFKGFGTANFLTGAGADVDTLHRVASVTKTFTTTAILQLRDEGKLQLDDPLTKFLPEFERVAVKAGSLAGVTLRKLLCHHSGLMSETPLPTWDALDFPPIDEILAALPQTEIVIPQDSAFKYSNLAFGLLGEVIARVSGMPYFEYVHKNLLEPLGMTNSVFTLDATSRQNFAVGYMEDLYSDQFEPAPYSQLNGVAACGQLHSSVGDLAKWISAQFRTDAPKREGKNILKGTTLNEIHRPQFLEPDWSIAYCLGWRANRYGNEVFHGHGGGIHGFASQVSFSKKHRLGVVTLANIWPHPGVLPLASDLLLHAVEVQKQISQQETTKPRSEKPVPMEYQPLLGLYIAFPQIPLQVAWRNGQLRIEPSGLSEYPLHTPAKLEPVGERVFIVRGGRGSGETICFEQDGERLQFSLGGFVYRRR
ncbi:MAG: serine hydrolase domain-containing protein [Planctomycetaceae bacterium]